MDALRIRRIDTKRIKEEPRVRVIYRMGNARKCGPIRDVEKEGKQRQKRAWNIKRIKRDRTTIILSRRLNSNLNRHSTLTSVIYVALQIFAYLWVNVYITGWSSYTCILEHAIHSKVGFSKPTSHFVSQ